MAKYKKKQKETLDKLELYDLALDAHEHALKCNEQLYGREDRKSIEARNQALLASDKINQLCGLLEEI